MPIILENVSHKYAIGTALETPTLHEVSTQILDGEYVAVMGRTGCGKSTFIQLIAGLLKPTAGRILVDGEDINLRSYNRAKLRRKVGVVFQYPEYQLFETTVERDVAFGLRHTGISRAEIAENVRWALETVGFDYNKIKEQPPMGLSGGEKRRIAIAGVLAVRPSVLILDEPVAGLDPEGRESFLRMLDKLNGEGATIIIVSHNADDVCEHAKRVIIMDSGRIVRDDTVEAVFSDEEFLKKHGIGFSQAAEIANMLREKGFDVPAGTIKHEHLLKILTKIGKAGIQ